MRRIALLHLLVCYSVTLAAAFTGTGIHCAGCDSRRRQSTMQLPLEAVLLEYSDRDVMVPGEVTWIHLYDEDHTSRVSRARGSPFADLLAQPLHDGSTTDGAIVPLLQLLPTRRKDRPGMLVEAICVGRGIVLDDASDGAVRVAIHGDGSREAGEAAAMEALSEQHSEWRDAIDRNHLLAEDSGLFHASGGVTREFVKAFLEPLHELIGHSRNTLRRRGLRPEAEGDDEDSEACASDAELLSYVACRWLDPEDRACAVEMSSTTSRLELCSRVMAESRARIQASLAVQQALHGQDSA